MEQLLARPEIQSAVVPFVVGLIVALGLRKFTASAWIWALLAAFLCSVLLINGTTLMPLTGTRKIILLVLGACLVAALLPYILRSISWQRQVATGVVILAMVWVFWPVIERQGNNVIIYFLAGGLMLIWSTAWALDRCRGRQAQLHGAGLSLLLGTGLCAMLGSSALLGQLSLALAAGCGGLLLAWVLPGNAVVANTVGRPLAILPYLMPSVMIGLAATLFASLPWYTLASLVVIPLAVSLVTFNSDSRFLNALVNSLPGLAVAAATALWTWYAGSSSASGY